MPDGLLSSFPHVAAAADELGPGGRKVHPGISSSILDELHECNVALSQQRKKRQVLHMTIFVIFLNLVFYCNFQGVSPRLSVICPRYHFMMPAFKIIIRVF